MNPPLTEAEILVGIVFVGGLFVLCFLFFGWHPQYQAEQSKVADAQMDSGDYAGVLSTSGKVLGALFVIVVVGIVFVVSMDGALDVLNAANGR